MIRCMCQGQHADPSCNINCDRKYKEQEVGQANMQMYVARLIDHLGEDINREGLIDTPKRYVKFMQQFLKQEPFNFTTFENEGRNDMVIVKDIPFYSLCEHHLAPFFGVGHIAYIPNDKIVGISKLPRTLDMFARKFQNQERITTQVADFIEYHLKPKGIAVVLSARHMCMEMRGIQKTGANTITSAMLGVFKDDVNARQEFLNLIK